MNILIWFIIGFVVFIAFTIIDLSPKEILYFNSTSYIDSLDFGSSSWISEQIPTKVTIQQKWIVIKVQGRSTITLKVEKKEVKENGSIRYRCVDFREIPVLIEYNKTNSILSMQTLSGTTYRNFKV